MIATREQRKEVPQTFKALPPQFENYGPRSGHWLPYWLPKRVVMYICVYLYMCVCVGMCVYVYMCVEIYALGKLMLKTHVPYPRCDMPQ